MPIDSTPTVGALRETALQLADQRLPQGWELVDSSAFARVAWHHEKRLYYKEFLPRSPFESIKAAVRGSRATRARHHNDALRQAGFDAPVNVAWGALPAGREYLFTAEAAGQGIDRWLTQRLAQGGSSGFANRCSLLNALGHYIGQLHAAGFFHGDLRPGNVLAEMNGSNWQFVLIDNESNRNSTSLSGKLLLKNLMQLNMLSPTILSRADRMRFFRAWRQEMIELSPLEAKILGAEAYLWAMRRLLAKDRL